MLNAVYPALLAITNNIAPYVEHMSPGACSKILQLFSSMSTPSFLLANETNHNLLASILESINSILEHQFSSMFQVKLSLLNVWANQAQKTRTLYTPS